jgi:hypothetical protein
MTTINCTKTPIFQVLRERIEQKYRADLAALARLQRLDQGVIESLGHDEVRLSGTHFEVLHATMATDPARWWSVAELSEATGLNQSAIRSVTYTNPESFERDDAEPKRRRWRIRES